MRLEHFHSDWNGLENDKPYNTVPTNEQVLEALKTGKTTANNCRIFAQDQLVEVKAIVGNNIVHNTYRDLYRIVA